MRPALSGGADRRSGPAGDLRRRDHDVDRSHASGLAVACAVEELTAIATIDLRVDYLRAAEPDLELYARSDCYRLTRNVAFVRAVAWDRTADDPFASALGTFMLGANRSDSSFERLVRGKKHDFELDPDDVRTIDELVA